eukprot:TRINITY_DN1672_c0_g1_i1.p2 TRINITY_DN1672_c0_g1~~TRINITY_DN1672_c0_g1_i1.p2  ORF type:complete len:192 (-),score=50.33 TRINITY_DN1672_c0_g1_i1:261-836(-)
MAFTSRSKIRKTNGEKATPFEEDVAKYVFDIQQNSSNADLKKELEALVFNAAKEVDLGDGKKAAIVFVPPPALKDFHRIQSSLVEELEKKLAKPVMIVGQRKIVPKPAKNKRFSQQIRPISRTLTAVHEAILEDVVYPAEITDRRIRIRVDGGRVQKVTLDNKDQTALESKLDVFSKTYKRLTGKDVTFTF